jgi:hypothetical protein
MAKYVIIENTPGYMPEDDDPSIYDTKHEALRALRARRADLIADKDYLGMPKGGVDRWRVTAIEADTFYYYDNEKDPNYDLGRVVQILLTEDEESARMS